MKSLRTRGESVRLEISVINRGCLKLQEIAPCNGIESHKEKDDKDIEDVDESSPTVKVVGMEMTTSCEGGQKWNTPGTPVVSR